MESNELLRRIAQKDPTLMSMAKVRPDDTQKESAKLSFTLDWAALLASIHNEQQLSTRFCTLAEGIARQWQASRVTILSFRANKGLEILGCSKALPDNLSTQDSKNLINAGQEACDQKIAVWASAQRDAIGSCKHIAMAQYQLAREGYGLTVSFPLGQNGQVEAALVAEFETDNNRLLTSELSKHWSTYQTAMESQSYALASTVSLMLSRSTASHFLRNPIKTVKTKFLGRTGLTITLVFILAILGVPISDPVSAPARIEGQIQRQITSPNNGLLKTVHARPGDKVRAGQLIAELKERDFELERSRLQSERAAHEGNYRAAMAKGDRAGMILAQSKTEELDAQLGLIATQIDGIQVRSPIDGVIISTDLTTLVGNSIERGQTLAVVAPENDFRIIIEIDERDLGRVKTTQLGSLALSARPFESLPLSVDSIAPAATVLETGNAIEVHAKFKSTNTTFVKPGLRGVAHLEDGNAPLAWIWYRQSSQFLQLWAWRWLPWLVGK